MIDNGEHIDACICVFVCVCCAVCTVTFRMFRFLFLSVFFCNARTLCTCTCWTHINHRIRNYIWKKSKNVYRYTSFQMETGEVSWLFSDQNRHDDVVIRWIIETLANKNNNNNSNTFAHGVSIHKNWSRKSVYFRWCVQSRTANQSNQIHCVFCLSFSTFCTDISTEQKQIEILTIDFKFSSI